MLGDEKALLPDAEPAIMHPRLHHSSRQRRCGWQPIEHTVKGHEVVSRYAPLFEPKAFPGEGGGEGAQPFFHPAVKRLGSGGGMHTLVATVAPSMRLSVQVIQIRKAHAGPEAVLDQADAALDFALGLRGVGPADTGGDATGGQKVSKLRVPFGCLAIHLEQHALHTISEDGSGQPLEILAGLLNAADKGGRVAALGEADKAHARVAEHGGKAVELVDVTVLLIQEFAPVDLHLLAGLGLVASNGLTRGPGRAERLDKLLENAERAGIALGLETFEHGLAVEQSVVTNPGSDLVLERVKFGGATWARCGFRRTPQVLAYG